MGHVGHVSKKHGILLHGFTTSTTSSFIQTTRKITRSNLRGHEVIFADTLNICHWKRMEKDYRCHGHHWKKIKKTQFQASSVLSFIICCLNHIYFNLKFPWTLWNVGRILTIFSDYTPNNLFPLGFFHPKKITATSPKRQTPPSYSTYYAAKLGSILTLQKGYKRTYWEPLKDVWNKSLRV